MICSWCNRAAEKPNNTSREPKNIGAMARRVDFPPEPSRFPRGVGVLEPAGQLLAAGQAPQP